MYQKKAIIASLIAILFLFLQGNSLIACEYENEYTQDDVEEDQSNNYTPTYLASGTLLDRLIERYPILDTIIQMILEIIQNFLSKLYTPS